MQNIIFLVLRRMRLPLIVLVCTYAFSVLGFVLIPGIDDQGNPWRMGFFHAFYFVSYMGSTIGFGELPYAFTDGQRLWTTFTIYASVISWLYAIGSMLSLIQEPAFRQAFTRNAFTRSVRRISEPFYLVCGYGDTGSLLVRALADKGLRSSVVDIDQERINGLELADMGLYVPGLCANATDTSTLLDAGLKHRHCIGVVALTNEDHVNLKVAITSRLLNPEINVFCRAESPDECANMASFGTDYIINPFDTFAEHLAMAIDSPGLNLLHNWLTNVPQSQLEDPVFPPRGNWLVCGYGRFGKSIHHALFEAGIHTTIIEARRDMTNPPPGTVTGRGTEASTLHDAGIKDAVGIIAGTEDDANNLSIVMTASE
ncbi:potassium channel family protein, partial [Pseudomonadota bacterium]